MGTFAVNVVGVGNHGCGREVGDGGELKPCGAAGCVDCITRGFLEKLRSAGAWFGSPELDGKIAYGNPEVEPRATIRHWPGTEVEVMDDLLAGRRKGNF